MARLARPNFMQSLSGLHDVMGELPSMHVYVTMLASIILDYFFFLLYKSVQLLDEVIIISIDILPCIHRLQ